MNHVTEYFLALWKRSICHLHWYTLNLSLVVPLLEGYWLSLSLLCWPAWCGSLPSTLPHHTLWFLWPLGCSGLSSAPVSLSNFVIPTVCSEKPSAPLLTGPSLFKRQVSNTIPFGVSPQSEMVHQDGSTPNRAFWGDGIMSI